MKKRLLTTVSTLMFAGLLAAGLGIEQAWATGPGGHFGRGGGVFAGLEKIHGKLQLTAAQEAAWQEAVALGTSIQGQAQTLHQQAKAAADTELAKAQPDLAALAQQSDSTHQQVTALHKQVRDKWLAVYATLSAEQKTVVADFLRQRLQHGRHHG